MSRPDRCALVEEVLCEQDAEHIHSAGGWSSDLPDGNREQPAGGNVARECNVGALAERTGGSGGRAGAFVCVGALLELPLSKVVLAEAGGL